MLYRSRLGLLAGLASNRSRLPCTRDRMVAWDAGRCGADDRGGFHDGNINNYLTMTVKFTAFGMWIYIYIYICIYIYVYIYVFIYIYMYLSDDSHGIWCQSHQRMGNNPHDLLQLGLKYHPQQGSKRLGVLWSLPRQNMTTYCLRVRKQTKQKQKKQFACDKEGGRHPLPANMAVDAQFQHIC